MSKITQTKSTRARLRTGKSKDGKHNIPRIIGYRPAQPRERVTCRGCGRSKMLSVGQIWKCEHKD